MADDRPTNDPRPASGADEPTPPGAGTPDPQAPDASAVPGGRFPAGAARPTLAAILFHVLQEYARHAGHLDVVRELIDGHTGE